MGLKKIIKILKRTLRIKSPLRRKRKRPFPRKVFRNKKATPSKFKTRKRSIREKAPKKKPAKILLIGEITHYFPRVRAAVLRIKRPLALGDPILIKGKKSEFRQTVASIQINRKPIEKARRGQEIGLEVLQEVRSGDLVYAVISRK